MESRIRIWSPFVIAYVGGMVTLLYEVRIGDYLGIYNPLFGYMNVEIYAEQRDASWVRTSSG